jgi:peptidoglycan/LPS O-acetylase OafA/YrhL
MRSVGERRDERAGFGAGFDFLRLFLAVSVVAIHTSYVMHGPPRTAGPAWLFAFAILPMFFALGGFLVAASAERLPLRQFLLNRGFRIFPAMIVEIALSACILGPLVSDLPLGGYLEDPNFPQYFLGMVGWVQFDLPGVFRHNPFPTVVNGSLWTVPQDLAAYALLACLIAAGLVRRHVVLLIAVALLLVDALLQIEATAAMIATTPAVETGTLFLGTKLMASFFCGCAIYLLRYRLPCHPAIAGAILAALVMVSLLGDPGLARSSGFRLLALPLLSYLVVILGHMRLPRISVLAKGDYSYGIYLYAFPLQQLVSLLLPGLQSPLLHFSLSMALTLTWAGLSWHWVEKPLLRYRSRFSFVAHRPEAAASLVKPESGDELPAAAAPAR